MRRVINWRSAIRTLSLLGALALISYGVFQPVDQEVVWLRCIWGAAPLLGIAIWLSQPDMPRSIARSVFNLGLVIACGFGLLSLQLLRQQFVMADAIYSFVGVDDEGNTISNIRPVLASQRILRGEIRDARGVVLVASEAVNAFARRTYPLAARYDPAAFGNIVGFVSNRFGQSGLEATYSDYLSGARGSPLKHLREDLLGIQRRGANLDLTLNADLQARVSALLAGRTGSIVIIDPRTGAVNAMASAPGFDPSQLAFDPGAADYGAENERIDQYWRQLNSDAAGQPLLNRPTQGQYPPGSTYKAVTAIEALEQAGIGQPDSITCPEQYVPDPNAPPVINSVPGLASLTGDPATLERVFAYSCNTAFAQYASRLGSGLMIEGARRFDIHTPQEAERGAALFRDLPTIVSRLYVDAGFLNQPRALADTGYGQGQLLVTPLQMALVAASIANDGILMQPFLVQRVSNPDGQVLFETQPQQLRRTMSSATAATMRNHMRSVAEYGFGAVVSDFLPGITVGGKSGTAQHVEGATPHAWFIAIAPLENPRYAVAVMVESGGEGSSVGGTLAGQALQAAFETE
jgi:peptidoglycan glycosyltransferase